MFITLAPSRLPASSKLAWVRVEASKNMLIWVRPLQRVGALVGLAVERDVGLGEVEHGLDVGAGERLDAEEVAVREQGALRAAAASIAASRRGDKAADGNRRAAGASAIWPVAAGRL